MRKPLVVLVFLIFLGSMGAAASTTIVKPAGDDPITGDSLVKLQVNTTINNPEITYHINGGAVQDCNCTWPDWFESVDLPQGAVDINVTAEGTTDSGEEDAQTAHRQVFVDTRSPRVTSISPEGDVFALRPEIRLEYDDRGDAGSGVNTSRGSVTLTWPNGSATSLDGTADADAFTYTSDSDFPEGQYELTYRVVDNVGNEAVPDKPTTFTLPVDPVLSGGGVNGTVATRMPELTLRARDPAGIDVDASSLTVEGVSDGNIDFGRTVDGDELSGDDEEDVTLTYDGLSLPADGRYEVEATVVDMQENKREEDWTFTVDTTPPVIDEVSHADGDVISGEEEVRVRGHDELGSVAEASFSLAGAKAVDRDEAGGWFSGRLDTHPLEEGFQQLLVSLWDDAGNVAPPRTINVTVDNTPPQFPSSLDIYPATAATHLRVTGTVTDEAAGVDAVTYTVNGSDVDGALTAVDGAFDTREERFAGVVDVSALDAGRHTLYVRAEDDAGHRSAKTGAAFTVRADAEPSLVFVEPANLTVERGKETRSRYGVKNTGDIAEYVELTASSERNVTVGTGARKIGPGETKQFRLTAVGGRTAGTSPLTLTADGLATTTTWKGAVIVQPRPAEQQRIRDRFAALEDRFEELNASSTAHGLDAETLDAKLVSAGSAVAEIEQLLEEGRYRAAEERLDETAQLVDGTETTFTGQMTRYRVGQAASLLVHLVLFAVAAFATVFGYRSYRVEEGFGPRQDGMDELRQRFRETVERFRRDDGEAGPEEWKGFSG